MEPNRAKGKLFHEWFGNVVDCLLVPTQHRFPKQNYSQRIQHERTKYRDELFRVCDLGFGLLVAFVLVVNFGISI